MSTAPEAHPAPPQGTGYYERRTGRWWDENLGRWCSVGAGSDGLEVRVETILDDSAWRRRFPSAARLLGPAHYRFVADATSDDLRWPSYHVAGRAFSMARPPSLGGGLDALPWADVPQSHLNALVAELFLHGWQPESHGAHWWSLQMTRPCVEWPQDLELDARRRVLQAAA